MKKIFNVVTITLGVVVFTIMICGAVFIFLTSIDESTGTSVTGETKMVKGIIKGIACYESIKDINFSIAGVNRRLYINRGMEKGLTCENLRNKLIDKSAEIFYVGSWLDPREGTHINRLVCNGEVIYSELK
jgi:hypothetical protein